MTVTKFWFPLSTVVLLIHVLKAPYFYHLIQSYVISLPLLSQKLTLHYFSRIMVMKQMNIVLALSLLLIPGGINGSGFWATEAPDDVADDAINLAGIEVR